MLPLYKLSPSGYRETSLVEPYNLSLIVMTLQAGACRYRESDTAEDIPYSQ